MEIKFSHTIKSNVLFITLLMENLDATNAPSFKEKLLALIQSTGYIKIIIDMSNIQFIDSSGLGALLALQRALYNQGGKLKLIHLNQPVQMVFEIVSMQNIFEVFQTAEDAIHSF